MEKITSCPLLLTKCGREVQKGSLPRWVPQYQKVPHAWQRHSSCWPPSPKQNWILWLVHSSQHQHCTKLEENNASLPGIFSYKKATVVKHSDSHQTKWCMLCPYLWISRSLWGWKLNPAVTCFLTGSLDKGWAQEVAGDADCDNSWVDDYPSTRKMRFHMHKQTKKHWDLMHLPFV